MFKIVNSQQAINLFKKIDLYKIDISSKLKPQSRISEYVSNNNMYTMTSEEGLSDW